MANKFGLGKRSNNEPKLSLSTIIRKARPVFVDQIGDVLQGDIDMNNFKIVNLKPPVENKDAVTKEYSDQKISILDGKYENQLGDYEKTSNESMEKLNNDLESLRQKIYLIKRDHNSRFESQKTALDDLQKKNEEFEKTSNESMEKLNNDLESFRQNMFLHKRDHDSQFKDHKTALDDLQKKIQTKEEFKTALDESIEKLNKDFESLRQNIFLHKRDHDSQFENHKTALDDLQKKIQINKESIEKLNKDFESLRQKGDDNSEFTTHKTELDNLQKTYDFLHQQISLIKRDHNSRFESQKTALDDLQKKVQEEFEKNIKNLEKEIQTLKQSTDHLQQTLTDLKTDLDQKIKENKTKVSTLETNVNSHISYSNQKIETLETNVNSKISDSNQKIKENKNQVSMLETNVNSEISDLNQKIETLKTNVNVQIYNSNQKIYANANHLNEYQKHFSTLNKEIERVNAKFETKSETEKKKQFSTLNKEIEKIYAVLEREINPTYLFTLPFKDGDLNQSGFSASHDGTELYGGSDLKAIFETDSLSTFTIISIARVKIGIFFPFKYKIKSLIFSQNIINDRVFSNSHIARYFNIKNDSSFTRVYIDEYPYDKYKYKNHRYIYEIPIDKYANSFTFEIDLKGPLGNWKKDGPDVLYGLFLLDLIFEIKENEIPNIN